MLKQLLQNGSKTKTRKSEKRSSLSFPGWFRAESGCPCSHYDGYGSYGQAWLALLWLKIVNRHCGLVLWRSCGDMLTLHPFGAAVK
jgi:hypothetical protein